MQGKEAGISGTSMGVVPFGKFSNGLDGGCDWVNRLGLAMILGVFPQPGDSQETTGDWRPEKRGK